MQKHNWGEGTIQECMENPYTNAIHIEFDNDTHLKLCISNDELHKVNAIANECNAILQWLGVPKGFTTYLWWIDRPRFLEKDEWPSRKTVNGGWTVPGMNTIYVYRREEWQRVLIHETIHALQWDWPMPTKPLPCWGFDNEDTVYPHLFEAWTELYAEWLYCGWFNQSWVEQRKWQDMQALQILARETIQHNWSEDTNIFSYYVLKACLAPHIEFLWAFRNGQNDEERYRVLCGLVKPRLEELRKQSNYIKPREISMRMTVGAK